MDLKAYFERINYRGDTTPTLSNLQLLHRAHVSSVPFENLDIHYKQWIELVPEKFYSKVVEQKRGGFCYELNGLLYDVLHDLGFHTYLIACSVYIQPLEKFGPYFGHVAIMVNNGEEQWLVDVGFGSSFPEPLKMEFDLIQQQDGVHYCMRKLNDAEISLDRSFDGGKTFVPMYKFTLIPRQLEDFQEMCVFHQTSEQSPLYKNKLCSIATSQGRITLTPKHLIITQDGQRTEQEIKNEQDFLEKLSAYFAIDLPLLSSK